MRKLLALLICAALFISAIAACGNNAQNGQNTQAAQAATQAATQAAQSVQETQAATKDGSTDATTTAAAEAASATTQAASAAQTTTAAASAQTSDKAQPTAPGQLPITTKPVTLSVLLCKAYSNVDYSLENNIVLKWMMEKTGVTLAPEYVSSDDFATRSSVVLSSGDYPDFFWGGQFTPADVANYGVKEKIFIPLNDLIANYSFWFNDALAEMPDLLPIVTQEDGNVYGIPNTEVCYHCSYSKKMWINYDWLDALKLGAPESTDAFYDMLRAFKSGDPNGNGAADEIPLTGSTGGWNNDPCTFILNSFLPFIPGDYSNYLFNDKGTIRTCATMDEYREGLRYMNKLYAEGLLDQVAFTQSNEDLIRMSSAETKVYGAAASGHLGCVTDIGNYANEKPYKALAPLEGPTGRRAAVYLPQGVSNGAMFAISDSCEYPEIAWRFLDFQYWWEADMNNHSGMEGIVWERLPEDTDLVTTGGQKAIAKLISDDSYSEISLTNNVLFLRPSWMGYNHNYGWFANELPRSEWSHGKNIVDILGLYTDLYVPYGDNASALGPINYPSETANELSQLQTAMKTYLDNMRIQFITGTTSLDKDWDSYTANVNNSGIDQIIKIVQDGYDRMYKK